MLELRRGDVITTRLGAGRVRGWSWRPGRGQVHVEVALAGGIRHVEMFADRDVALWRPRR